MGYSSAVFSHPIFWLFLGSALVGAGVSRATRPTKRRDSDGKRDSTGKWVFVSILLSIAVVCGTVGFLRPQIKDYLGINLAYAAAFIAALSFVVLRFRRAVGLPVMVLLVLVIVLFLLLLQSLVSFTGETEIAEVTVLSSRNGLMKLDVRPAGRESTLMELEGEYFSPVVKVVIFDDYLVFLGRKTWYRFEGMTSFQVETDGTNARFRQSETDYYFPKPTGISESVYRFFEKNESDIPGVKSVQVDLDLKRVQEDAPTGGLRAYSLRLQNDGGIQIVPKSN